MRAVSSATGLRKINRSVSMCVGGFMLLGLGFTDAGALDGVRVGRTLAALARRLAGLAHFAPVVHRADRAQVLRVAFGVVEARLDFQRRLVRIRLPVGGDSNL